MRRLFGAVVVGVLVCASGLLAQEGIEQGKIKKIDADKNTVTVTIGDKDTTLDIGKDTKIVDAKGGDLKIKDLKEGADVEVTCDTKDGKTVCNKIALTK